MASTPTTTTGMTARGKVTAVNDGLVTFLPYNTAYALHLAAPGYAGPMNTLVVGSSAHGAKAYTVPAGEFNQPITGRRKRSRGAVRAWTGTRSHPGRRDDSTSNCRPRSRG